MTKSVLDFILQEMNMIVVLARHDAIVKNSRIINVTKLMDPNKFWIGTCDMVSEIIIDRIKKFAKDYNINLQVDYVHGEIRHSPKIKSENWVYQHTWVQMDISGTSIYLDGTCQQFRDIWPDIPNWYVSLKPPKWFYPDRRNPMWVFKNHTIQDAIGFVQYNIWGKMSDIIHNLRYSNN